MESIKRILKEKIKLTPMMEQYIGIKKDYADTILLFRMGDFYEVFFEDAKKASEILSITLTQRGKIGPYPIPMAGIPHHAANAYINRITDRGLKVAICEQVEDPKATKGIVKRAVTQVASPGIPFDLEKMEEGSNQYIAATAFDKNKFSLTLMDFTTGQFFGFLFDNEQELVNQLRKYQVKELLTFHGQWSKESLLNQYLKNSPVLISEIGKEAFNYKSNKIYLKKFIPHYEKDQILSDSPILLNAIGSLSFYVCSTQSIEELCHINPFQLKKHDSHLKISIPTLRGLEIFPRINENYKNSLLGFMDQTKSPLGKRKLRDIFLHPLKDREIILERQSFVKSLVQESDTLETMREHLSQIKDLGRLLALLTNKKITPTHLFQLAHSLNNYLGLLNLHKIELSEYQPLKKSDIQKIKELSKLIALTLNDEMGASLDKGNLINPGFNKKRDRLAKISVSQESLIQELEEKYRKETGINKLRIKKNNVAGYYIEVSKIHTDKVGKNFTRKQTLVNSERYNTPELTELEKDFFVAKEKLLVLEREIFDELLENIKNLSPLIQIIADNTALIDVLQSFSWTALQDDFKAPEIFAKKKILHLQEAWHPLIKKQVDELFVPHNVTLDKNNYFALITGPNMAGKTTVMREIAIIQFLAQLGSFVPAQKADLPLVDLIFSRLGASDDILNGQSTFMVEMSETAEILRHSTKHSLILLDEVGRGTSTYDGLSIAWALVEHIAANIGCFTLFSTHYHELIDLAERLPGVKNFTVETKNNNGDIDFLYHFIEGGANQSFGIYVAKLAGLPTNILKRSQYILDNLENDKSTNSISDNLSTKVNPVFSETQLSFLEEKPAAQENKVDDKIAQAISEISELDLNNLTPMQALQELNELRQLIQ